MFRWILVLNQNCRSAARLISRVRDEPLPPAERVGLSIHLAGCKSCRRYRKQIGMIEEVLRDTANNSAGVLPGSAKERIAREMAIADGRS